MESKKEKLEKNLEHAQLKLSQTEHKVQALENQRNFLMKKEDRQRTHHLCNMGGAIQSEYYGAAEPPVRCGESHLSGLTEPPHFIY